MLRKKCALFLVLIMLVTQVLSGITFAETQLPGEETPAGQTSEVVVSQPETTTGSQTDPLETTVEATVSTESMDLGVEALALKDRPLDLSVPADEQEMKDKIVDENEEYFVVKHEDGTTEIRKLEKVTRAMALSAGDQKVLNLDECVGVYDQKAGVDFAEKIVVRKASDVEAQYIPNDPYYQEDKLWGFTETGADKLLGRISATSMSNVVVAVLDTGVDYTHPDLADAMWQDADGNYGKDLYYDDMDPMDEKGHGTHVAGIIGAKGGNGQGVVGVASGVKIMAVKVLGDSGSGFSTDIAAGINYAVEKGAKVINMSLGSSAPSQIELDAIENAYSEGVIVVAASGNDSNNWAGSEPQNAYRWNGETFNKVAIDYPAAYDHVIAVGSVGKYDDKVFVSDFSNSGTQLDVVAPGEDIYSTMPHGTYSEKSGTSMATPHVAALAALIKAAEGNVSFEDMKSKMSAGVRAISNTDDSVYGGNGQYYGSGLIQCQNSVPVAGSSTDSQLASLKIDGQVVSGFAPGTFTYSFTTPSQTVTIEPVLKSTAQSCLVNGKIVEQGEKVTVTLEAEHNVITVQVKAGDNQTLSTYTLNVTNGLGYRFYVKNVKYCSEQTLRTTVMPYSKDDAPILVIEEFYHRALANRFGDYYLYFILSDGLANAYYLDAPTFPMYDEEVKAIIKEQLIECGFAMNDENFFHYGSAYSSYNTFLLMLDRDSNIPDVNRLKLEVPLYLFKTSDKDGSYYNEWDVSINPGDKPKAKTTILRVAPASQLEANFDNPAELKGSSVIGEVGGLSVKELSNSAISDNSKLSITINQPGYTFVNTGLFYDPNGGIIPWGYQGANSASISMGLERDPQASTLSSLILRELKIKSPSITTTSQDITATIEYFSDVTTASPSVVLNNIVIARQLSNDTSLKVLDVQNSVLSPGFTPQSKFYTVTVPDTQATITLNASKENPNSKIIVYEVTEDNQKNEVWAENKYVDGTDIVLPLTAAKNKFVVSVFSEADLDVSSDYTVNVFRKALLVAPVDSQPVPIVISTGSTNSHFELPPAITTGSYSFTVDKTITDASLDLGTPDAGSALTVPVPLNFEVKDGVNPVADIEIPQGVKITATTGSNWDGTLQLPEIKTSTLANLGGGTANKIVEIGMPDFELTFDKPVRILLPGMAGKSVKWSRGGSATEITKILSADTADAAAAELVNGAKEGKVTVGSDLVVWTTHFTEFVAYTPAPPVQNTPPAAGGGGGGGGGGGTSIEVLVNGISKLELPTLVFELPSGVYGSNFTLKAAMTSFVGLKMDEGVRILSDMWSLQPDGGASFLKSCKLTMNYTPSKVDSTKERVSLYWLDEKTKKWSELDNITVSAGKVTGTTQKHGVFALLVSPQVAGTVIPTPTVVASEISISLTDVKGHWAAANIQKLLAKKAISGNPDGTFQPEKQVSRAEFITMLVKALELKGTSEKSFSDLNGHWAKGVIQTAVANGIVNGFEDGTIRPDALITREQMAVMIAKAKQLKAEASDKTFADQTEISGWAKESVLSAVKNGIIGGYADNTFKPQALASKAEAVTMIARCLN